MRFSLGFVLAALALASTASPISTSLKGTKISLSKRASMTNPDGTANIALLHQDMAYATRKIQNGLAAYQANMGQSYPLDSMLHQKRKTGADSLTGQGVSLWYGNIQVGTPPVTYKVDFDTGSSDIFLPSVNCNQNCQGHTRYNPAASHTSADQHKTFTLTYGDGSTVSGEVYTDTVSIAGLTAKGQAVGSANTYSNGFAASQFMPDGLVGMGFPSISAYNMNPLFQTLVTEGQTTASVFAFKLAKTGSELFLGGVDHSLYTGSFFPVPVISAGYWQVYSDGVSVNNAPAVGMIDTIIDTGTTLVIGDITNVQNIYAKIPGSKDATNVIGAGFYTIPCSSTAIVSMSFGGESWDISTSALNFGPIALGSPDCVGGIAASSGFPFWIVGDVFLQNVYTRFNIGLMTTGMVSTVSFAQLA